MEEQNTDRRVRKTRAQLRQALTALLREKSAREITVRELAERADVNRGTFYRHYRDIPDMLEQLQGEVAAEFEAVFNAYTTSDLRRGLGPILQDVFCLVEKHADLCGAFLGSGDNDLFFQALSGLINRKVRREWSDFGSPGAAVIRDYCLDFTVAGAVGLVRSWLEKGDRESPEEMAALAERLICFGVVPQLEPGGA